MWRAALSGHDLRVGFCARCSGGFDSGTGRGRSGDGFRMIGKGKRTIRARLMLGGGSPES